MRAPKKAFLDLFVVALLVVLSAGAFADASRAIKADYPVTKLTDRVYVIYGPLGEPSQENQGFRDNVIIAVTNEGVVVMDPGTSVYVGEMVLKKIAGVTDQPVVAVFNSHVHGDHWLGNQAFQAANPKLNIYAHANMINKAKQGEGDTWIQRLNDATGNAVTGTRPVIPNHAVKDSDEIKVGELTFRIYDTGPAHTDGDIMIEIVEEQVLFTGDIVREGTIGAGETSFKGNLAAIDRALATQAAVFIPGHGKAGDSRIVKDYRNLVSTLRMTVAKHFEAGLSDFEIKPKVVEALSKYKDWSLFEENIGRMVSLVYLEVESEAF